jgi:hypothetical protein
MAVLSRLSTLVVAALVLSCGVARAQPETVTTRRDMSGVVGLRDVQAQGGVVTGTVVNQGPHQLRDVQLLIRHAWVWNDDRHPGPVNPGTSSFVTVAGPIAPGAGAPFSFREPSSGVEDGAAGHFTTDVQPMGYTEVVPGR